MVLSGHHVLPCFVHVEKPVVIIVYEAEWVPESVQDMVVKRNSASVKN
jgi:hypothetical protein